MRKSLKYIFISLVFVLIGYLAHADEPVKKVYKSWPIEDVSEIIIENQFGNIDFVAPRTDSVTVEATFDIQNLSKNNAEYLAEQVHFNISSFNKTLKIETTFTEDFKTNKDFKIRIRIQTPENCNVNITNRFGDVNLNNLMAQGNFNIEYGNLKANQMNTTNNTPIMLDIKYGRAEIKHLENLNAKLNYGELICANIGKMDLDVQYSIVDIDKIGNAKINSHLDNISIDTVNTLTIESNYSTLNIKSLSDYLDVNMKHGELDVDQLLNGFDKIKINNFYGKVFMNTGDNISYTMISETFFTEIDYTNGTILEQHTLKDQIFLKSKIGSEENNSLIDVKSRYGTVHITR
jgi:hypothetical protein